MDGRSSTPPPVTGILDTEEVVDTSDEEEEQTTNSSQVSSVVSEAPDLASIGKPKRARKTPEQRAAERAAKVANGTARARKTSEQRAAERAVKMANGTARARKTAEQRDAERKAKIAYETARARKTQEQEDTETKEKKIKPILSLDEKITAQALRQLDPQNKKMEQAERRKLLEEKKQQIIAERARQNAANFYLPRDIWLMIWNLLSMSDHSRLRRTAKYFMAVLCPPVAWKNECCGYISHCGLDVTIALKFLKIRSFLDPGVKIALKREDLDHIQTKIETLTLPRNFVSSTLRDTADETKEVYASWYYHSILFRCT